MAVNLVTGTRGLANQPNSVIRSVSKEVYLVKPYATPLVQIAFSQAAKTKVSQPKYEYQHDLLRDYKVLSTGYTGGSPTATMTDATNISFYRQWDVVTNIEKGQNLQVTNVNTGTNVVTFATLDGSNVTTSVNTDHILFVNSTLEQGGAIANPKSTVITFPYNYTEIFTTTYGVDNTTRASKLYQGSDWDYQKSKAAEEHKWQIERAFLYGQRSAGTGASGRTQYTTGGLVNDTNIISSNRTTFTDGSLTYGNVTTWLQNNVFKFGTRKKVVLGNYSFMAQVMAVAAGNIRIDSGKIAEGYGLEFDKWYSPFGSISFILMPQIEETKGVAIALDPGQLKAAYLRDTHVKEAIQNPNLDAEVDALITECGLWYAAEETCAIFKGV